ncbi:MAG: EF-P lysine aminoacylase GenX [Desulfuromonas sp.]|nr:MAG: EF-P lysine aminoacylase GenX [Desulfuromonas sp.]
MTERNWALARKHPLLAKRARIIQTIRAFFIGEGFLEVETPHRIPANAPEPHIDAIESENWALQTSPELAMKRLLAAGYPDLFQICKVWRQGERGHRHLPEFTLLEWYRSGTDYRRLMNDCISLLQILCPAGQLNWQGEKVDLNRSWELLTVTDAFDRYTQLSVSEALSQNCFEELLTAEIEPHLGFGRPTFLTDYPHELAALSRRKLGNPQVAERFELYLCGLELANAFSELTDPAEQRSRFEGDEASRRQAGKRPWPLPEPFLAELPAMPESAGIALGIDRLVMLLTDQAQIDDVVALSPEQL